MMAEVQQHGNANETGVSEAVSHKQFFFSVSILRCERFPSIEILDPGAAIPCLECPAIPVCGSVFKSPSYFGSCKLGLWAAKAKIEETVDRSLREPIMASTEVNGQRTENMPFPHDAVPSVVVSRVVSAIGKSDATASIVCPYFNPGGTGFR